MKGTEPTVGKECSFLYPLFDTCLTRGRIIPLHTQSHFKVDCRYSVCKLKGCFYLMGEKSTFLQTEVNGPCEGVDKCGLVIVSSIIFDAMV